LGAAILRELEKQGAGFFADQQLSRWLKKR